QVAEIVGAAQRVDVVPGEGDLVAFSQAEQQFGFERAFEMQVQFGFGQGVEPVVHERTPSGKNIILALLKRLTPTTGVRRYRSFRYWGRLPVALARDATSGLNANVEV